MEIKVRPAQLGDAQRIWEIRNEPASLAVAASQEVIPLPRHIDWFDSKYFKQDGNFCFVGEVDGNVVGYCRFDLDGSHYLNSIAVSSSMHGKGIGTLLLGQSVAQLKTDKPIHAEVRKYNLASVKIFERNGFQKMSEDEKNIYYQLT
ncbi:MAG: GNAT family N-acetyltransferase [Candidatus Yanofskybacteria bacterium]|nr:GNAT family N-acetyltransferase [Candidatus Yanofskybacteria bacterium]